MSLAAAAITEETIESAPRLILNEWLKRYFDGAAHAVGGNAPVAFPAAEVAFGQGPITQPLESVCEIRVVTLVREPSANWNREGQLVQAPVTFNFWVRAKKAGTGQGQRLVQQAAQLLFAILRNPTERLDLAVRGITQLSARPPQEVENKDYYMRMVSCGAQLQYDITL